MKNFLNDYNDKGHEKVYEILGRLQEEGLSGYGLDEYSLRVKDKIRSEIGRDDLEIEFLPGGTIANIVATTHTLMSYEAVVASTTGHISIHESGAIEATGHKVVQIETKDGKLHPQILRDRLALFGVEHDVVPKIVYISNTTETGTVYSLEEIKEIYDVCLEFGMYLYVDGARLAVAMAKYGFTLKELSEVCDIFTIGGTKNGAMFGEVLVVVDDDLKERLRNHMKQKGSIMAKGFILSAQFDALFEDGLYYELGKISYDRAMKLKEGLEKLGIVFAFPAESNQLFISLSKEIVEELKKDTLLGIENLGTDQFNVRLCTSYRTTEKEIEEFLKDLESILKR